MNGDGSIVIDVDIDDKQAAKRLQAVNRNISKLQNDIQGKKSEHSALAESLKEAQQEAIKAYEEVEQLKTALASSEQKTSVSGNVTPEEFIAELGNQEQIKAQLAEQEKLLAAKEKAAEKFEQQDASVLAKLEAQTRELEAQKELAGGLTRRVEKINNTEKFNQGISNAASGVNKGLKSILKWGIGIRSVFVLVRRLKSYLQDAVKTFAESDPETKAHIDGLRNSLASLKASWGAAFAPILSLVTPILQTLISWLTRAANAVAAFFAALSGKGTYKRAVANADKLSGSVGGVADAAKEAKKGLMGIDELNVMSDNDTGGSGGGGTGGGAGGLEYEDVEISDKILDNLRAIQDLVIGIGGALAGWTFGKILKNLGLTKGGFKELLGFALMLGGAVVDIKGSIDAWENGVNKSNLKEMLGGSAVEALGAYLTFGKVGFAIQNIISGLKDLVIGIHDWAKSGELSDETCTLITAGLVKLGVAISVLTGNWLPLIGFAVAALALQIYQHWDEIKEKWEAFKSKFGETWKNFWGEIAQSARDDWNKIKAWFGEFVQSISENWDEIKEKWGAFKENFSETWKRFWSEIAQSARDDMDNLKRAWDSLKDKAASVKDAVVDKFEALRERLHSIVETIKNLFHFEFQLPHLKLPHITVQWQPAGDLGRFFGISSLPSLGVQWYARGGIVDGATLIGAGEAGKEAIVPLERNTQWVGMVARELADMLFSHDVLADIADSISLIPPAIDRLVAQFANVTIPPIPAVAQGYVVPPNAVTRGGDNELLDKLAELLDRFSGGSQPPIDLTVKTYLDKRQIGEAAYSYIKERERGRGI